MNNSNQSLAKYESDKKLIFDKIVSEIEMAQDKKLPQIYIRGLEIIDEIVDVVAKKEDWETCLSKALTFYKEIEDYESCSKCQKLMDLIKTKKSKTNGKSS